MAESKAMSPAVHPAEAVKEASKPVAIVIAGTNTKHPTYATMVIKALADLAERNGSSRQAILKYILGTFNMSGAVRAEQLIKGALKAQMEAGSVVNASGNGSLVGRFKLSPAMKAQLGKAGKKTQRKEEKSATTKKSEPSSSTASKPKKSAPSSSTASKPKKAAAPSSTADTKSKKPVESKPNQSVKKSTLKPVVKSPKGKDESKSAGSKSKVTKRSPAKKEKKASKSGDNGKSPKAEKPKPKKSAAPKAQTVDKKGPKADK